MQSTWSQLPMLLPLGRLVCQLPMLSELDCLSHIGSEELQAPSIRAALLTVTKTKKSIVLNISASASYPRS